MIRGGDNIHIGLEKIAGGGARTFKSWRRAQERIAKNIAERQGTPEKWQEIFMARVNAAPDLHHVRPSDAPAFSGASGKGGQGKKGTTFFTQGGLWPSAADPARTAVDTIPLEDISKMRGKFGIDHVALDFPPGGDDFKATGPMSDALVFARRGKMPPSRQETVKSFMRRRKLVDALRKKPKEDRFIPIRKVQNEDMMGGIPGYTRTGDNPFYDTSRFDSWPKGDLQVSRPYVKRTLKQTIGEARIDPWARQNLARQAGTLKRMVSGAG